jgi:hypothetical protein
MAFIGLQKILRTGPALNLHLSSVMADQKNRNDRGLTIPEAKRTGREAPEPRSMPAEFADDLRTNRSTPPPDPPVKKR